MVAKSVSRYAKRIKSLEKVLKKHQCQCDELAKLQAQLVVKAGAAALAVRNVAALLELGALLEAGSCGGGDSAWREQLLELGRDLDEHACGSAALDGPPLGWSPAAAAARAPAAAAAGELCAEGMAKALTDFTHLAGCLLP